MQLIKPKLKFTIIFLLSILIGFLIGRFLVFYLASTGIINYISSTYTKLVVYILGGGSLLAIGILIVLHKKKKMLNIKIWPLISGIITSITIWSTFYARGIDASYHYHYNYDVGVFVRSTKFSHDTLFQPLHIGIISKWGNILVNDELDDIVGIVYDNKTKQKLILGFNITVAYNSYFITISCFNQNSELVDRLSFETVSDSEITIADKIKEIYGNPIFMLKNEYLLKNIESSADDDKSSNASTPVDNDYNDNSEDYEPVHYEPREPERHETKVPIQVWNQCGTCWGSGQCNICYGQGYYIDNYGDYLNCSACIDGRCSRCAGQGGHYEVEYHTKVDYY